MAAIGSGFGGKTKAPKHVKQVKGEDKDGDMDLTPMSEQPPPLPPPNHPSWQPNDGGDGEPDEIYGIVGVVGGWVGLCVGVLCDQWVGVLCDQWVGVLCDQKVGVFCDQRVGVLCDQKVGVLCDQCMGQILGGLNLIH